MKKFSVISSLLQNEIDPAYKRRARLILKNIYNNKKQKILEIGCGRGFYLNAIYKINPNSEIYGVDINKKYLKKARETINKNIKLIQGSAIKLPFKNNYFDVVIMSEVLEHIEDDSLGIKEMYRVLKNGGRAVVTVPNQNYPFFWDPTNWLMERLFRCHLPSNIWWLSGIWADHRRLYKHSILLNKLRHNGFKILKYWTSTKYCLPFSHFLFYGIGKNIVDRGLLNSFDRFDYKQSKSVLRNFILKPIRFIDGFNKENRFYQSSVNLVYLLIK